MNIDLASIGLTQEEVQERVIAKICSGLLTEQCIDNESGDTFDGDSSLARALNKAVREQVDNTINNLAAKHVLPNVAQYIENLTLQATNQWGEKSGKSMTFIEYLVQRAELYMSEQVSYDGKGKAESRDNYSWKGTQTRLAHMIHQHLHYSIETAMKSAMASANAAVANGIAETAKVKLAEIAKNLKVQVSP